MRLDNWEKYSNEQPPSGSPNHESFEAGADAYEEALRKTGYEIRAGESFGDEKTGARTIVKVDGHIIFIPEERK